ncbi:cytochrome B [Paramagnetospirillum kuznetsovii]|uniref:Cytochrome B n=1 Tax=Paramagnetospirillum kuznetsovii TaxID=2053833 RepID=A0A364NTD5_9PROT|nr:cytochrome b/b6 domain-containing protein [Paramagnetospirillum kuznetsovii]RAU20175.1 cytochrome B [Paramagnetospirillum kuznetsovii]
MTESAPVKPVVVWDLPIRLFHWCLAALVAVALVSGHLDKLTPHMKAGTLILALLLFRLGWGVVGSPTARFAQFVGGPGRIRAYLDGTWTGLGHNPLGALSVLAMLALLLVQAGSGLFATDDIATDAPLAWMVSSAVTKRLSTLHRLGSWAVVALVAAHLAAIAFYRIKKGKNLVAPMISGHGEPDLPCAPQRLASPWLALALAVAAAALVFGALAAWGR